MIVWDLETAAPKENEEERWEDYKVRAGLGLAVLWVDGEWEFFFQRDLVELVERLEETEDEVVSYNGIAFDHVVVDAAIGRRVTIQKEVDLWEKIKEACGQERWPKGSWTLSATCERTLGKGKTSTGMMAPTLLRQGKVKKVLEYCMKDVILTRDLHQFIQTYGYVLDPMGNRLNVSLD